MKGNERGDKDIGGSRGEKYINEEKFVEMSLT